MPHPKEKKNVKEIFETFLKVGSVRETCRELSQKGIFSKKYVNKHGEEKGGGHFTVSSLFRILTNQAYIGLREIGRTSTTEAAIVKASWSGIIEEDLFLEVQKKLSANKNKYKPESWKKYAYPLTERVVCGECGKKLGGKSAHGRNRKHRYYGHPRQLNSDGFTHLKRCGIERVRAERLEELGLKSVKHLLEIPGLIEKLKRAIEHLEKAPIEMRKGQCGGVCRSA